MRFAANSSVPTPAEPWRRHLHTELKPPFANGRRPTRAYLASKSGVSVGSSASGVSSGTEISPSLVSCCGERRSFAPGASFVTLVAPSRLKAESLISHTAQSQSCDHGICTSRSGMLSSHRKPCLSSRRSSTYLYLSTSTVEESSGAHLNSICRDRHTGYVRSLVVRRAPLSGFHAPRPSCEPTTCRCSPGVDCAISIWKNRDRVEQVPQRVISIRWQPMAGFLWPELVLAGVAPRIKS
mmetsp:Transcript_2757/g.6513  ORF Transcript_2757/g.6513 Transcript_2757/m.6513 type:complete len:239 (+) Transcript_2757:902-1618(+)